MQPENQQEKNPQEKTLGEMSFEELWQITATDFGEKGLAARDEILRRQKAYNGANSDPDAAEIKEVKTLIRLRTEMTKETNEKLAQEAALRYFKPPAVPLEQIILAAIEKARKEARLELFQEIREYAAAQPQRSDIMVPITTELNQDILEQQGAASSEPQSGGNMVKEARFGKLLKQVPSSEPQECRVKRHNAHALPYAFFVWIDENPLAGPMTEGAANEASKAINAALAASEAKLMRSQHNHCEAVKELAAERELVTQAANLAGNHLKRCIELENQLIAEREKLENAEEQQMKYAGWAAAEIKAQIAARKPLVEALERIRDDVNIDSDNIDEWLKGIIDAALAQAGEKP